MALDERPRLLHQREYKVMDYEADRSLPTKATLRVHGNTPQSPYVFVV